MKYPIGDVARTLGLTPGALHYFEREGVLSQRSMEGGRRVYSREDMIRLISYRKYRSMEVPMKDIALQFASDGWDASDILERLEDQQAYAQSRAQHYMRLSEAIGWYQRETRQAVARLGEIRFAAERPQYLLSLGEDGFISRDRTHQGLISAWLEHQPAVGLCVLRPPDGRCTFGYAVDKPFAEAPGFPLTDLAVRQESTSGILWYQRLDEKCFDHPDMAFQLGLRYLDSHRLVPAGTGVCRILCVERKAKHRQVLCRIWLPIDSGAF